MLSCGFETRLQILSPHKKYIGWAFGVKITSRCSYGRRRPNGQLLCEVLMLSCGVETRFADLVPIQEVYKLGGWW
jgi:hypothetical protein